MSINLVNAVQDNSTDNSLTFDDKNTLEYNTTGNGLTFDNENLLEDSSIELEERIKNAGNGDAIIIEPGTYHLHDIQITKNLTLSGNGNPREIIIDGEEKSSIFLIRSDAVHVSFKNITFINAKVVGFGGAISMETGHAYVDNCIFANNTASVNAGGISNYGTDEIRGYLLVNNSLFINNHGDHDGGAITTCKADSYIYNSVFINNSAHRDGGAIRVSVAGYGDVQDCIFMFNHADEWGGAYYSWSGTSNINRCIFLNNTAGTNGGAVMVSGDINLENSIIMNNYGGETGGSFYIQQPMYKAKTVMNIHNNLITNNSSPYGKEVYISWKDISYLYTKFDNNDWGDEDPNDSSVIDPDNNTPRSKVSKTIKSNLLSILNVDLLDKYADLLKSYFTSDSMQNLKNQFTSLKNNETNHKYDITNKNANNKDKIDANTITPNNIDTNEKIPKTIAKSKKTTRINDIDNPNINNNDSRLINSNSNSQLAIGNSTSHGEDEKAYELNETGGSVAKQINSDITYFIALVVAILILLAIGYKRNKRFE